MCWNKKGSKSDTLSEDIYGVAGPKKCGRRRENLPLSVVSTVGASSDNSHPSTSASSPSRGSRVYHLDRCSHPLASEHECECSFLARFLICTSYGSNFHKPASWTVGDAHVSTTATCVDHRSSTANARAFRAAPRDFSEELSQAPKNFPVPGYFTE